MTDAIKPEAPKASAHAKSEDEIPARFFKAEDGQIVFDASQPDLDRIAKDRKRVSDELKESDKYESDGLGDNFSGDASEKASDHLYSPDPAKRAFPPGPDDPSKV